MKVLILVATVTGELEDGNYYEAYAQYFNNFTNKYEVFTCNALWRRNSEYSREVKVSNYQSEELITWTSKKSDLDFISDIMPWRANEVYKDIEQKYMSSTDDTGGTSK